MSEAKKDKIIEAMFDLLDDLDTADDFAKSNDKNYRVAAGQIVKMFKELPIGSPDGYSLAIDFDSMDDDWKAERLFYPPSNDDLDGEECEAMNYNKTE